MPTYDYKSGDTIRAAQDYRVIEILGVGGMGGVYLAEHRELYRNFAVKVLHAELWHRADLIEMFGYEARTVARLGQPEPHPGIIEVVDLGRTKDRGQMPYMVMPYLIGETLHDALVRRKRLPVLEAIGIVTRLLQALDHAHRRGVVHRDVKPQNIFVPQVSEGISIKVLDWGISKLLAQADDPRVFLGTPAWASKEQMLGEGIGPLSDVYSAAAVLFRCLTGTMPFARYGTELKDLRAAVQVPAPRLREFGDFPRELEAIVASGLSKDLAARPRDALAFAEELQRIGLTIRNDRNPHTHVTERVEHAVRARELARPDPITEAHIAARTVEDPQIQCWIEAQRRPWRQGDPTLPLDARASEQARAAMGFESTEPIRPRRHLTEPMPRRFDHRAPGDGHRRADGPPALSARQAIKELPTRQSGLPSIVSGLGGSVRYVTDKRAFFAPSANVRDTLPSAPLRSTVPMARPRVETPAAISVPTQPAPSIARWAQTKYRWFFGSSSWKQLGRPLLVSAVGTMLVTLTVLRFGGSWERLRSGHVVEQALGAAPMNETETSAAVVAVPSAAPSPSSSSALDVAPQSPPPAPTASSERLSEGSAVAPAPVSTLQKQRAAPTRSAEAASAGQGASKERAATGPRPLTSKPIPKNFGERDPSPAARSKGTRGGDSKDLATPPSSARAPSPTAPYRTTVDDYIREM